MKKVLFKSMMVAGLTGMMVSGCVNSIEDAYDPQWIIDKYEAEWKAAFGDIDPEHNWNTAVTRTAEVSVGYATPQTVKIYTANPRNMADEQAYLLGKFEVAGMSVNTLTFDMPACLQYVYVALIDAQGNRVVKPTRFTEGKFEVAFGEGAPTRAAIAVNEEKVTTTITAPWEYGKADVEAPLQMVPEFVNNLNKLTQNFVYESTGPFTIYPMYLVTSNMDLTLGVYFLDENGEPVKTTIWTREGYVEKGKWVESFEYDYNGEYNEETQQYPTIDTSHWEWTSTAENTNDIFPGTTQDWGTIEKLRCKGITVDIPVGTRFGLFATNSWGTMYSEKELNPESTCYAATFVHEGKMYLSFEDWRFNDGWETSGEIGSDADFNDLVCLVQGVTEAQDPIIVDKEEKEDVVMQYRIACEDLGGTNDFDFNDVVLGIEHVAGTKEVNVSLLAAGGTLEAAVLYDGQTLFDEVHAAFGVSVETMVNTGIASAEVVTKTIAVDNFSIATDAAKFDIQVKGRENIISVPDPDKEATAPQAFVVADPIWEWPSERQPITNKYPSFTEWVSNSDATNWSGYIWGELPEENPNGPVADYGTLVLTDDGTIDASYFSANGNTITIDVAPKAGNTSFQLYACLADGTWTAIINNVEVDYNTITTITLTPNHTAQIIKAGGLEVYFNSGRGSINGLYIK